MSVPPEVSRYFYCAVSRKVGSVVGPSTQDNLEPNELELDWASVEKEQLKHVLAESGALMMPRCQDLTNANGLTTPNDRKTCSTHCQWKLCSGGDAGIGRCSGDALSKAMEKYEGVVKERAAAIDEVHSLEQQNAELKKLMNQYLSADVNDELHVPPTQVIRVGN